MDIVANQPIVVDSGSGVGKWGIAGESRPKLEWLQCVGRPKHDRAMIGSLEGDALVGAPVQDHRGLLTLKYPMSRGIVTNWEDMELIWRSAYNELGVPSEDHPLLVTEAPHNPRSNRDVTAQILFEVFNVPAVYFAIPAVLALYAAGKTSGLVLDIGDGVMHAVPVYQGFSIRSAILRSDIAGRDITEFLQLLLRKQGVSLSTSAEREIVREIKEKHCRLAPVPDTGVHYGHEAPLNIPYTLPDGQKIVLGQELSRAPEILFQPVIQGSEDSGAQTLLADCIARADRDLRASLYQSITLSGGSTQTAGFGPRLLAEMKALAPPQTKLRIFAPPERNLSVWSGGSILAGLSSFTRVWLTAEEWSENPDRIHALVAN